MGNRSLVILLFIALFSLDAGPLMAAACCGGSSVAPLIMSKEAQSIVSFSMVKDSITHNASSSGEVQKKSSEFNTIIDQLNISGIYSLTPFIQIAGLVTYLNKYSQTTNFSESSSGIKNATLQMNYEFMPEYFYSLWRPRGFVFLNLTLPVGKSIYESSKAYQTDALSSGQYSSNFGVLFKKNWSEWDFSFATSIAHYFSRNFKQNSEIINVGGNQQISCNLEAGFSPNSGALRLGVSLDFAYQSKKEISESSLTTKNYHLGLGLSGIYQFSNFIIGINFLDQSYFSIAKNKALTKAIGIKLNKDFY